MEKIKSLGKQFFQNLQQVFYIASGNKAVDKYNQKENIKQVSKNICELRFNDDQLYFLSIGDYIVRYKQSVKGEQIIFHAEVYFRMKHVISFQHHDHSDLERSARNYLLQKIVIYCYEHPKTKDEYNFFSWRDCFVNTYLSESGWERIELYQTFPYFSASLTIRIEKDEATGKYNFNGYLENNGKGIYTHNYQDKEDTDNEVEQMHKLFSHCRYFLRFTQFTLHMQKDFSKEK